MSIDFLASYHYMRDREPVFEAALAPGMVTICDSGAFSAASTGAAIKLSDYAQWLREWGDRFLWCASLDVIGDPQATYENWMVMRDQWGLVTVPTVHFGTDPVWLRTYSKQGATLIGLGGMVGRPASRVRPWLVACFKAARALPGVRFHGWGFGHGPTLAALPFYSVDSSGPIGSAYRFGELVLFDTRHQRSVKVKLDGRTPWRHAALLREQYHTDPAAVAVSNKENRLLLGRLAVTSIQRHAAWLRSRHQVRPPALLGPEAAWGTRLHTVDTSHDIPVELARLAAAQVAAEKEGTR